MKKQTRHYDKFLQKIQQPKMKELWDNAADEPEPKAKKEYLEKIERISKGKFVRVDNFAKRYGLE